MNSGLTDFKSDLVEGLFSEVSKRYLDATTGKSIIIGKGITAHILKYDNGELFTLKTKMPHSPSSKHRLMEPQCLGIQDR